MCFMRRPTGRSKRLDGAKIAAMGLAYKKNINDPRGDACDQDHRGTHKPRGQYASIRSFSPIAGDKGRGVCLDR